MLWLARILMRMGCVQESLCFRCAFLTPGLFALFTALNNTLIL